MAKETTLRYMVSVGIGLVIADAAFLAFAIPLMARHPEFVNTGSSLGYWFFVSFQLIVAAFLFASFIPNRHNLKRITASLILVGIAVILLGSILIQGIDWYLGRYGFYDVAILLSIFIVTNLIAGILLIIASIKIKRSTSSEKK
jgi:hypothetical protein